MDRFKLALVLVLFLFQMACSKKSEVDTKFPITSLSCLPTAHQTRYVVRFSNGEIKKISANSREEMIEKYVLPNLANIEFVEQDQLISLNLPQSDSFFIPSSLNHWGPDRIKANYAWDKGFKGQNVIVAVIDSGTEITHEALKNNLYVNEKERYGVTGIDDDENGFIDDFSGYNFADNTGVNNDEIGHGTHVSGIISADNTVSPHKSIAPESKIMPLDFMSGGSGYTSDAIAAIDYATANKAQIINASWGSGSCSQNLEYKINELESKNVLFVVAAGNSGNDLNNAPEFPAVHKILSGITVGSMTFRGFLSSFSNYGDLVDLVAPGSDILSTYKDNSYSYLDGTSMATPMVAGVAALLLSAKPSLLAQDLKNILEENIRPGSYFVKTKGEIDVERAINSLEVKN